MFRWTICTILRDHIQGDMWENTSVWNVFTVVMGWSHLISLYSRHSTKSLMFFDAESVVVSSNYFYGWCWCWILYVVCVEYYGSSYVWLRCCTGAVYVVLWLWLYCGRDKWIFSSPKRPDGLWGPPSLLFNGYRVFYSQGKAAWPPSSAMYL